MRFIMCSTRRELTRLVSLGFEDPKFDQKSGYLDQYFK